MKTRFRPPVNRRTFLSSGLLGSLAALDCRAGAAATPWPVDEDLEITDVRVVRTRAKNPLPSYEPKPGSYWATREAARPIASYPDYTGKRGPGSKWMPDPSLR